jgi:hypothetical protein
MDINNFLQSKGFKIAMLCVAIFIALFLVFSLGVYVGTEKASFSFRWAEQYHNNFAGPSMGFFERMEGKEFMESNGVFGKIIQVNADSIVVSGRNDAEKVVLITDKTIIKKQNTDIKIADLKVDDEVVIIGNPNESGQIDARLIRVMSPMSANKFGELPTTENQTQNQKTQELNQRQVESDSI